MAGEALNRELYPRGPSQSSPTSSSQQYSLRWHNHQMHLLHYFESLLQSENLVDVTLVGSDSSVRAHKVVLSACSPYFQRIFAEHPCKHPVVVLKDLLSWELQALVDFMYRGEISVAQEQISTLIRAAESLKIRGLTALDREACTTLTAPSSQPGTPRASMTLGGSQLVASAPGLLATAVSAAHFNPLTPPTALHERERESRNSSFVPYSKPSPDSPSYCEPAGPLPAKLPHLSHPLSFGLPSNHSSNNVGSQGSNNNAGERSSSPVPRRKQARPRRRSGDLSTCSETMTMTMTGGRISPCSSLVSSDVPENLSMKKSPPTLLFGRQDSEERERPISRGPTPTPDTPQSNRTDSGASGSESLVQDAGNNFETRSLYSPGPSTPTSQQPMLPATTPPIHPHPVQDRRKGQHSAPRGGPPRAWTNSDLTEALHQVWNRKMTTSQASRVFGIPYNSLLMYVRGKYGKSLRLDTLRRETLEGEAMAMAASTRQRGPKHSSKLSLGVATGEHNNNNNSPSTANNNHQDDTLASSNNLPVSNFPGLPPGLGDMDALPMGLNLGGLNMSAALGSGLNPYLSYFGDFSFPMPMNMMQHLLPHAAGKSKEQLLEAMRAGNIFREEDMIMRSPEILRKKEESERKEFTERMIREREHQRELMEVSERERHLERERERDRTTEVKDEQTDDEEMSSPPPRLPLGLTPTLIAPPVLVSNDAGIKQD